MSLILGRNSAKQKTLDIFKFWKKSGNSASQLERNATAVDINKTTFGMKTFFLDFETENILKKHYSEHSMNSI